MKMDFDAIKEQLLSLKEELDGLEAVSMEAAETVELDQSRVGRLSRMDALQAQAMSQESLRRRQVLRQRIAPALQRIANGDYGFCMDCDETISEARLHIDPTNLYCIDCAEKREA